MDMVRERELNVPIFQKQKPYQAQAVRRKCIKKPFEKRIFSSLKGQVDKQEFIAIFHSWIILAYR